MQCTCWTKTRKILASDKEEKPCIQRALLKTMLFHGTNPNIVHLKQKMGWWITRVWMVYWWDSSSSTYSKMFVLSLWTLCNSKHETESQTSHTFPLHHKELTRKTKPEHQYWYCILMLCLHVLGTGCCRGHCANWWKLKFLKCLSPSQLVHFIKPTVLISIAHQVMGKINRNV